MRVTLHTELPDFGSPGVLRRSMRMPLLRALMHRRRLRRAGYNARLSL